ncbi:sigma-70 family RNA polymerase sigma factor [Paucisalibacillus globulus]|uniref:sigma-70 family RNA polymerase sigma factor n=1 Tax=Paucisalibacillus globulus TaxID=351095 RepID=UPI001596A88A|nr:sigma-70 family RNA polymerase sigma factor [Paucisalibacillus globulus]
MNYQGIQQLDNESHEEIINNLIISHGDELKRMAFLYLNDLAQAEDIVQEVFISVYKNLHKFNHKSTYKTWLYRITINKCKDYQKKWSYKNILYRAHNSSSNTNLQNSVQDDYELRQEQEEILQAISKLPAKYKELLIFYYYKDMSIKEISEITGVKINTLKSRITRGRHMLKVELERRGIQYE